MFAHRFLNLFEFLAWAIAVPVSFAVLYLFPDSGYPAKDMGTEIAQARMLYMFLKASNLQFLIIVYKLHTSEL